MNVLKKAWRRTPSVSVKFFALLAPAVATITAVFCGVFYFQKNATLQRELLENLSEIVRVHADMLSVSMGSMDLAAGAAAVRTLGAAEAVVCVEARDELLDLNFQLPNETGCEKKIVTGTVSTPVMRAGQRIGFVKAGYVDDRLRDNLRADVAGAVSLAFLVLLGAVAAAVQSHRVAIGRPLKQFLGHVGRAEREQDRSPLDWESADEMGRVIAAYNRLLARLAEDEAALAAKRDALQATLDNVDQGVLMVDADLRLALFNHRAAELLGLPESALAGRPFFVDVLRRQETDGAFADAVEDFDLRPDGVEQATRRPIAFKRRRPDGVVLEARSRPLAGGGFVRTLTDVTAEARASAEMVKAMQDLEAAYRELKETQASLLQAEKMASLALLAAGFAHEINTPVGIALGCAGHLAGKTDELAAALDGGALKRSGLTAYVAQAAESTRLINQNLARAVGLIRSLKEAAADQASQERRTFDLADHLAEALASLQPRVRDAGAHTVLQCPAGIMVDGYPGALAQAAANLVVNALVHGFDDGRAGTVVLSVTEDKTTDWLTLRCADDGRGVPPECLPRLFEPFYTTKRGAGGTGLGLHIVYNLAVQTLGGRIDVESPPDGGAVFTIRFPRIAPPSLDPSSAPSPLTAPSASAPIPTMSAAE